MFHIQWIILPMHCNDKRGWERSRADLLPRVDLTFSGSLSPSAVTPQDIAHHFVNPEYLLPKILQNIQKYHKTSNPSAVMPQKFSHHSEYLLFKVLETFQRFYFKHNLIKHISLLPCDCVDLGCWCFCFLNQFSIHMTIGPFKFYKVCSQDFEAYQSVKLYQGGIKCANWRTGFIDSEGSHR